LKSLLFSFFILSLFVHLAAADDGVKSKLDTCISYYEDGDYQKAVDSIKALLPMISDKRDEAEAYKYIGFSYVMLDMINKAKDFFKVALEKFPQMVIDTLEVPPNITIVFKQTKIETQMEKGELVAKEKPSNRPIIATIFGATGVVSGIVGGYFLYTGYKSLQNYNNLSSGADPGQYNLYWDRQRNDFIVGGVVAGVACASITTAVYLFVKKPAAKKHRLGFDFKNNSFAVLWKF
jgi:tetratricopeptide (TPR) repeat protein